MDFSTDILQTERLSLRDWTPDDAEAYFEVYGDPVVMRYLGGSSVPKQDVEECRRSLIRLEDVLEPRKAQGFGFWAIVPKDLGIPVGSVLLKPAPLSDGGQDSDKIEIGWHLARKYWGRGYATESANLVMQYGFDKLGLDEIIALLFRANRRSRDVAARLQMHNLGDTRAFYDERLVCFSKSRVV